MTTTTLTNRKQRYWRRGLGLIAVAIGIAAAYLLLRSPALHTYHGHKGGVSSLAFSPDGRFLVSASYDTTVKVWDIDRDGAASIISANPGYVTSIALSPDGKSIVVASDENEKVYWNKSGTMTSVAHTGVAGTTAQLLEFPSGKVKAKLAGHTFGVDFVTFVSHGKFIATQSGNQIKLWDAQTGQEIKTLESIGRVVLSSDNELMVVVEGDDVKILEFASGKQRSVLKAPSVQFSCLVFSPDSSLLATGDHESTVKLWDVKTGSLIASLPCHQRFVQALQFSPDGILAVGSRQIPGELPDFLQSDGRLTFWDVNSKSELATLAGHPRGIISIAFSPRGDTLATGGCDGTIRLWAVPSPN